MQPGYMQPTEAARERLKANQQEHNFTTKETVDPKAQVEPPRETPKTRSVTNTAAQNNQAIIKPQSAVSQNAILQQQDQMMAQAQAQHQLGAKQNLIFNIFVLYRIRHSNQKMQLLIHQENYKKSEFIDLSRISFQVGRTNMAVYHHAYKPRQNFQNFFQLSFLDTGLPGLPSRNYYERIHTHHGLKHHNMFLMNMQIVPNDKHYWCKDPPGDSVMDPVEQLLVYAMFIFVHHRYDLFQDMMRDFTEAFPVLPELNAHQCSMFREVFDAYVLDNQSKLKENIGYLLPMLGLLPPKIYNMPEIWLGTTRILLEHATYHLKYFLFVESEYTELQLTQDNCFKGHQFLMQLSQSQIDKDDWLKVFEDLLKDRPSFFKTVMKSTAFKMIIDSKRIAETQSIFLFGIIDSAYQQDVIDITQRMELQAMILELTREVKTFFELLTAIVSYYSPVIDQWEGDGIDVYDIRLNYTRKLTSTVNRYSKNLINSLQVVVKIIETLNDQAGIIKDMFTESDLSKHIEQLFENRTIYTFENLPLFRHLFINMKANLTFLANVKMRKIIQYYYGSNRVTFSELYEFLLRDWNDVALIRKSAQISVDQFMQHNRYLFPEQIVTFNTFLQSYRASNEQLDANDERVMIEGEIGRLVLDEFYKQLCIENRYDLLTYLKHFSMTQSKVLKDCYFAKVDQELITPQLKLNNNLCVQRLLRKQTELAAQQIDGSIVAKLVIMAFAKMDQVPTIDSVRKQLIENPICDHLWYMLLEKYEHFKMQKIATNIADLVSGFALMVIERELTIEEIGKLQNQSPDQQKAFESYLHMAITIKGKENLRGSTMASYIENIKKELEVKMMQKSQLHAFLSVFMQLDSYHQLMVDYFNTNREFTKKRLRDYKFSEQLMQFLKVAEKVHFLQYSTIYTQYLDQKKAELGADVTDPFRFREACESAYDQLYLEITSFMMTPLSEFQVLKLKQLQGGQNAIGRVQIEREIDIFKKIYPHQETSNNTLQDLRELMLALSDREQTAKLCKSLIEMQSQKCYKKENKVGGMESQIPIFPVNINEEAEAALLFVQFCFEGINHLTADQYMNFFRIVQAQIVEGIKNIVTQQTLDETLLRGFLQPNYEGDQYEERKVNTIFNSTPGQKSQIDGESLFNAQDAKNETQAQTRMRHVVSILNEFSNKSFELLSFLKITAPEDLNEFKSYVNEYDEKTVTMQTVTDCIAIQDYLNDMSSNAKERPLDFAQLISFIARNLTNPNYKDIDIKISTCQSNIVAIQELNKAVRSQEEAKKLQILEIMRSSMYKFTINKRTGKCNIDLKYTKNTKEHSFSLESLDELKGRALLIQHTSGQGNREEGHVVTEEEIRKRKEEQEIIGNFITYANVILSVIENLNMLYEYGYPEEELDFTKKFGFGNEQDNYVLLNYERELSTNLVNWKDQLIMSYQSSYWLTFIEGRNFWLIESYLLGSEMSESSKLRAQNILKFMGKEDKRIKRPQDAGRALNFNERLIRLAKMLDQLPIVQSKRIRINLPIDELARITRKENELLMMEVQQPIFGLISLYVNLREEFPRPDQVLFCNESTTWQVLQCFIYRCVHSPDKELYSLLKPEQLTLENQDKITHLLQKLEKEAIGFNDFKLAIITTDSRSYISNVFRLQPYTRMLKDGNILNEDSIREAINQIDSSTMFVTSSRAGLGKTQFIKKMAKQGGKQLILFPIAGEITYERLGERFANLEFRPDKQCILCLQINFVDNMSLLNEILVNLFLFRSLKSPSNIFILPDTCNIMVELTNTFNNQFENQIFYRKFIKQREHYIDYFDLQPDTLFFKDGVEDQIAQVCTFLHMFNKETITTSEVDVGIIREISQNYGRCQLLMREYFQDVQIERGQNPNFIQMMVFVKIFKNLFDNFQKCFYFMPSEIEETVNQMKANDLQLLVDQYKTIRLTVVNAILITVKEFTIRSINQTARTQQNLTDQLMRSIRQEENKLDAEVVGENGVNEAEQNLEKLSEQFKVGLSWDSSNHFNIIFIEDGSVSFIYKKSDDVPKNIKDLIYIQSQYGVDGRVLQGRIQQGNYDIDDISKFNHKQLFDRLKILRTKVVLEEDLINCDYVLTPDNFLKMNVIFLRVQSKIPVIIMGETGCGKTSLIQFFCQNIRSERLEIFNIHGGVNTQTIIDKMNKYKEQARSEPKIKLWIFFDEFNTSQSLGLICEILCERTLLGEPLEENMRFLAACNPYKLRSRKLRFDENVGIKRAEINNAAQSMLMYTVNPLPDNILEYVWDFGALSSDDYDKYIDQMLRNARIKGVIDPPQQELTRISMLKKMLIACHKYFQENEDSSSVSLRDISRFIILYKFFKESLLKKQELSKMEDQNERYQNNKIKYNLPVLNYADEHDFDLKASILAICHCYYLRISSHADRERFLTIICAAQSEEALTKDGILAIVNMEQNDYLLRMELPEGTAVNLAIKENIFAMIPCIISKIPVFICGKPGCSKSLAISLIFTSLKGQKSADLYFKELDELQMVSFQGSDSCTSDGILQAYEKARNLLKGDAAKVLPVFVFDEIGLAELSKHNPLKVLHSLLEVGNREIAFVGISNWRLDASKMNRALYLARPDPDEEDLKFTAVSIYNSICPGIRANEQLVKDLASAYFQLKDHYKVNLKDYADFYGLRDFYHLIKQVSRVLLERFNDQNDVIKIVKQAIQRNFGGKINAAEKLGEFFMAKNNVQEIYPYIPKENVLDLISQNLSDPNSRYLMLICRADVATFILERKFRETIQDRRTIVGSNLENDINKEQYGYKSLSDIILYAEKGISIILKDMEHIYSSLYDLFNQNFSVFGGRRYCRIALGANLNPRCFVHEKFNCIIFMNEDDASIMRADAPFLNRFEKHYIRLESILTDKDKEVVVRLKEWVDKLLTMRYQRDGEIYLRATNVFPNYSDDTIGLTVLKMNERPDEEVDSLFIRCKIEMLKMATEDIIILANVSSISPEEKEFIFHHYAETHKVSFYQRLTRMIGVNDQANPQIEDQMHDLEGTILKNGLESKKLLAFTYSVGIPFTIDDPSLLLRNISNFKSEEEIVKNLRIFYEDIRAKTLIIQADYQKDREHISYLKFVVDKVERETLQYRNRGGYHQDMSKSLILLIHMKRNFNELENSSLPMFEGWESRVFYDIQKVPFKLTENMDLINTNIKNIIQSEKLFTFKTLLEESTEKCLLTLNFDIEAENNVDQLQDQEADMEASHQSTEQIDGINKNLRYIIEKITEDKDLVQIIKEKIFKSIEAEVRPKDWRAQVCCNLEIYNQSTNLLEAIRLIVQLNIEKYLTSILYILEKNAAFRSFFTGQRVGKDDKSYRPQVKEIWLHVFGNLRIQGLELQNLNQSNYLTFTNNLSFPFSKLEYEALKEIVIEQKGFEANLENQMLNPLENFAQNFNSRSKLGVNVQHLSNSPSLAKIYMRDVMRIFLIENLLKTQYYEIIKIILKKILKQKNQTFINKLYTFMMKQQIFVLICTILGIYFQIQKKQKENYDKVIKIFKEQLDIAGDQPWETMIGNIFDILIKDCYPDAMNIQAQMGVQNFAALLEKFNGTLHNLSVHNIRLQTKGTIKFWTEFSGLAAKHGGIEEMFLIDRAQKAMQLDALYEPDSDEEDQEDGDQQMDEERKSEESDEAMENDQPAAEENIENPEAPEEEEAIKTFLDDEAFVKSILDYYAEKNDEATYKFISSFFDILLDISHTYIQIISQQFESRGDRLFKFMSGVFHQILSKILIIDEIQRFEAEMILPEQPEYVDLVLWEDNLFLQQVESVFEAHGIDGNFGIIISDMIMKGYKRFYPVDPFYLKDKHKAFKNYLNIIERNDIACFPHTQKLVANTLVKYFLDVYLDVIYKDMRVDGFELQPDELEVMADVEERILGSTIKVTLQAYCLKRIKQLFNLNAIQLKKFSAEKLINKYRWAQDVDLGEAESDLPIDVVPTYELINAGDRVMQNLIKNIMTNNDLQAKDQVQRMFQECTTVPDRIKIGLVFMKAVYLRYSIKDEVVNTNLRTIFNDDLLEIAEARLGKDYANLLSYFIENFPQGNFLRMEPRQDTNQIHFRLIYCEALILLFSHRENANPLAGQFFNEEGEFSIAHFNQQNLIGLELKFKHEYLGHTLANYDMLKSDTWKSYGNGRYAKGSAYVCEYNIPDGCEYIYFVPACGGQMEERACPWCNKTIGGRNHVTHARNGHTNLTDDEARAYLKATLDRMDAHEIKGYVPVNPPESNSVLAYYQLLPITWRFLRLFLHVPIYYMFTQNKVTEEDLYQAFADGGKNPHPLRGINMRPKQFLEAHLETDIKILFTQLSAAGNDVAAPWVYRAMELMIPTFTSENQRPTSNVVRNAFQQSINTTIIGPISTQVGEVAQLVKKKLIEGNKVFDSILEEIVIDDMTITPYIKLYRMTRPHSFEDLRSNFIINPQNGETYKLLKICIENYQDLKKLHKFDSIIELTSALLPRFNHMLPRNEARDKPIKEYFTEDNDGRALKEMFGRFQEAWNKIGFEKKIQWGCKQLEYLKYTEDSPIINFLVDNMEPGNGMCMAAGLSELSNVQNHILNELINIYAQERHLEAQLVIDMFKYPVQRVKKDHILNIDLEDLDMLLACSMSNIKYGAGQETVYDFARIQRIVTTDILAKKFIAAENLEFIQYQLELISINGNKSALITEIRNKFQQLPLDQLPFNRLTTQLESIERRNRAEYKDTLQKLHGGLEKLLCFLLNAKVRPDLTIEEFCRNQKISKVTPYLREQSVFSQIPIYNIVAYYELLEIKYFPFITDSLRGEFMKEDRREEIKESFATILANVDKYTNFEKKGGAGAVDEIVQPLPSRSQIQYALLRFMIRCLAAQLEPDIQLMYYYMREDFWDMNMGEKLDNFESVIPAYINLSHTFLTYNVIAELNQAHDKKSQMPAPNQRAPPRQIGAQGAPAPPAQPARAPPGGPQPPRPPAPRLPPVGGAGRAPPGMAAPNRMDQKYQ